MFICRDTTYILTDIGCIEKYFYLSYYIYLKTLRLKALSKVAIIRNGKVYFSTER